MARKTVFDVVPSLPTLGLEGGDTTAPATLKRGPWPVGARLPRFLAKWQQITQDPWVLSVIEEGF